jgi:DNA replication protein
MTQEAVSTSQSPRDIGRQWTPKLKEAGFTAVSNLFLQHYRDDLGITNTEAMLVIHLMHYKWDEDAPYPSFKTLAHRMGLTEQQVRAHALSLVRKKLMKKTLRLGKPNLFHLEPLFKRLEEIYDDEHQDSPRQKARAAAASTRAARAA